MSDVIRFRCGNDEREQLDLITEATGLTASDVMRLLLRLGAEQVCVKFMDRAQSVDDITVPIVLNSLTPKTDREAFFQWLMIFQGILIEKGREDLVREILKTLFEVPDPSESAVSGVANLLRQQKQQQKTSPKKAEQ